MKSALCCEVLRAVCLDEVKRVKVQRPDILTQALPSLCNLFFYYQSLTTVLTFCFQILELLFIYSGEVLINVVFKEVELMMTFAVKTERKSNKNISCKTEKGY